MILVSRTLRFILHGVSPLRFVGPTMTLVGILVLGFLALTGKINFHQFDLPNDAAGELLSGDSLAAAVLDPAAPRSNQRLRVATFNIQRFGEKKADDAEVMANLARIVAQFDLVAIQEVEAPAAMPVPRLVELINRGGGRYQATVSPPIGRTANREQYAFIWDASRIHLIPDSAYVVRDDAQLMRHPPMVASFEVRMQEVADRQPFRFTVINTHVEADAAGEMDVLDDVFVRVRDYEFQLRRIKNVLLVGDLNVSVANLGQLGQVPGIFSVAGNTPTTTAGSRTADHILLDRNVTSEYTGVFGVFDYQRDYGLSLEQAHRVSDHRPLWAEFSAYEMPPRTGTSPTSLVH